MQTLPAREMRENIPNRRDRNLMLQAVAIIAAAIFLVGLLLGLLRLQASLQYWVQAHYHWVRAETRMADALEMYASLGDERFLKRAEEAMQVALGAREVRHAARQNPPDRNAIRRGMLQVGMHDRDSNDIVWSYLQMQNWPWITGAVDIWVSADVEIDRLAQLGREIKADADAGRLTSQRTIEYRDRINQIRTSLDRHTAAFSNALMSGQRILRHALMATALLLLVAFALLFIYMLRRFISRIRQSESWLRASFEQVNVGMLQLAADGSIRHANPAAARLIGVDEVGCLQHKLQDFVAERDQPRLVTAIAGDALASPSGEADDQFLLMSADGRQLVVRVSITEVANSETALDKRMHFAMIEDVSDAHEMRAELARQARYDELTGLINRRELLSRIGHALHQLKASRIAHLSVCLIDLDRFRFINESVGLRVGDRILQVIANRLQDAMGDVGQAGRLGGDQFVMLLPGMDSGDAMAFAARVSEALAEPDLALPDVTMTPTSSVGVVSVDRMYTSASEILSAAGAACERAKQAGRNRVRLLVREEEPADIGPSPAEWATEIRAALASKRLELRAQRIESCRAGDNTRHAELLLRMRDSEGRLVEPASFLPVAEMYGLTMDIDKRVLAMAMQAIGAFHADGGEPMLFYINLSSSSVGDPDFTLYVRHLLDDTPELAPMLCFEITESGMMANLQQATVLMDMLRQRGCKVALDDFGTGQSSFSQLRVLPVDIVKIDGSFMRDLDRDVSSEVLIRSICQMSHVLGKSTVVEWVERREDAKRICALGADYMQGFGLHRPEPLADFLAESRSGPMPPDGAMAA